MTPAGAEQTDFDRWHDEHPDECPVCNPHVCDDYCNLCEGPDL